MVNIILWVVTIVTCITGWGYGWLLVLFLSLLVGIEFRNHLYNTYIAEFERLGLNGHDASRYFRQTSKAAKLLFFSFAFQFAATIAFPITFLYSNNLNDTLDHLLALLTNPLDFKSFNDTWFLYLSVIFFIYNITFNLNRWLASSKYIKHLKGRIGGDIG
ncbi:hypothetical protein [uncultured Alistipes sp.]|uniref:hypothetical protein n=1 Tax=uncultured Alistipes sp. TaxID=538949 RepID=UPI0025F0F267|nr:hypothetical protein [uncultured Alistipes sp.]